MSTLTQTSLEAALSKIRVETENSINQLRTEFKNEVQNMEDKIASAVIKAIRASPPVDSMETDYAENNSIQSSNTAATMQTLADKYDSLHNAMIMLTKTVTEMAERQEQARNKRTRPLGTPPKFQLPPDMESPKSSQRSPPTKVPRADASDCPTTPPPNGTPTTGAREGQ
jgi:hypothetical protein